MQKPFRHCLLIASALISAALPAFPASARLLAEDNPYEMRRAQLRANRPAAPVSREIVRHPVGNPVFARREPLEVRVPSIPETRQANALPTRHIAVDVLEYQLSRPTIATALVPKAAPAPVTLAENTPAITSYTAPLPLSTPDAPQASTPLPPADAGKPLYTPLPVALPWLEEQAAEALQANTSAPPAAVAETEQPPAREMQLAALIPQAGPATQPEEPGLSKPDTVSEPPKTETAPTAEAPAALPTPEQTIDIALATPRTTVPASNAASPATPSDTQTFYSGGDPVAPGDLSPSAAPSSAPVSITLETSAVNDALTTPPAPAESLPPLNATAAPVTPVTPVAGIQDASAAPADQAPAPAPANTIMAGDTIIRTPQPIVIVRKEETASPANPEALAPSAGASTPAPQTAVSPAPVTVVLPAGVAAPVELSSPPVAGASSSASPAPDNLSEPAPVLSSQSRKMLSAVPSGIDSLKSSGASTPISIDHAVTPTVSSTNAESEIHTTDAPSHEALGVKINMATPKVDVNNDLEQAYGALISGNTVAAIDLYKRILDNDPSNQQALFGLGTAYQRVGQPDKARPVYARLLTLNPRHREGLNNFLLLVAEEAPGDALTQLQAIEARNPDFSPIPAQMAYVYQKLGRGAEAVTSMLRAVELSPENLTYRYNLAILFDRQGDRSQAANLYAQLLDAHIKGEKIPGDAAKIQQRLTFLRSN